MDSREARFANAATEQATKERLEAKRQIEWAAVQRANEENVRQKALVGTCQSMCPEYEREKRQRESAVDAFEKDPVTGRIDPAKAVKSFMRPSQQDIVPSDLRPPNVLKLTLNYLLHDVMPSAPFAKTLSFIWDRMRSIRQDLTIQNSRGSDAIELLERLARYYIVAIHEMRGDSAFPAKMTNDQLNGTLKSLAEMYNEARHRGEEASPNEAEFYSYYLVFAYDSSTLYQINQLPAELLANAHLQLALRVCALMERNNRKQGAHSGRNSELGLNAFSRFFKRIASEETPYLLACVFEAHFADVRLGGLTTLNRAYHIRTELSLIELAKRLGCDDDAHCATVCRDYNVPLVMEGDVPTAAILHNKYTEMDEHTRKLLPFGQPSRRLIDNKRRGASFTELCDGKTGDAPPTPVAAPSSRLTPQTPTPLRAPSFSFPPATSQSAASPVNKAAAPFNSLAQSAAVSATPPIAPFAFTKSKPLAVSPPKTEVLMPMLPPALPAMPSAPPPKQPSFSATSEPILKPVEIPKQPAPAFAAPSTPTVRTSPHLGKRKASSAAQDSPPLRRAPLPAAVLRKERLDAFTPPLAERLLEAALEQLIRDAAIETRLEANALQMSLQKEYREGMMNSCANELSKVLVEEAIKEIATSSVIDLRLLNQAFGQWQDAYEDACEEHERQAERAESSRAAALRIGKPSRLRTAALERDIDNLLRIGTLDLATDMKSEAMSVRDSVMDNIMDDNTEEDLWAAGTLVQPLLARADQTESDTVWTALVVVSDDQSIRADWWRCKVGMAGGENTANIPPLEIRLVPLTDMAEQDLSNVGLVLCDALPEVAGVDNVTTTRSQLDELAARLQYLCRFKPDFLLVSWTQEPTADIARALISDESRESYTSCTVLYLDMNLVDAQLSEAIMTSATAHAGARLIEVERRDLSKALLTMWTASFRRSLTRSSTTAHALLDATRRYQDALLSAFTMLSAKIQSLEAPSIDTAAPASVALEQAVSVIDDVAFDGFRETLLVVPAVDDVILALSYLEHFGAWLLHVLQKSPAEETSVSISQLKADLEEELASISNGLRQGAGPLTPAKAAQKSKRQASSPILKSSPKIAKQVHNALKGSIPRVTSVSKLSNVIQQAQSLLQSHEER